MRILCRCLVPCSDPFAPS